MTAAGEGICPVCGSTDISPVISVPGAPVNCNILLKSAEEALNAPRGDIRLGLCGACGHIYNTSFKPALIEYPQAYENSLHYSPVFQDYIRSQAVELIERHGMYEKEVIEIGCGNGDFLNLMSELGGNRGIGFDTSYSLNGSEGRDNDKVAFIREHYSGKYGGYKADLICCRQVLEHIDTPRNFLSIVYGAVRDREGAVFFLEVPNMMHTLRELSIWDIIYEHCSYYSAHSLEVLLRLASFSVQSLKETYEGQFLCAEAVARSGPAEAGVNAEEADEVKDHVRDFSWKFRSKLIFWQNELKCMENEGKKAVVWGGGSKGVSFLTMLRAGEQIKYVVDINPKKHGKHIPVTGQRVMEPGFLTEYRPDVIIVMNPIYIEEIWQQVKALNIKAKLLTA